MTVFCCDLDGVMWRGSRPISGSAEAVSRLLDDQHRVVFVTNNSFTPFDRIFGRIADLVKSESFELVTSPIVTQYYLQRQFGSEVQVLVVGEEGLKQAILSESQLTSEGSPSVVVVGLDREVSFEQLAVAHHSIRQGAIFLAANNDPLYPVENGDLPGAGALVAFLERSTMVNATILGKPYDAFVSYLRHELFVGPETIVIGDRLDQDYGLARKLGSEFWLVLSGSTSKEDALKSALLTSSIYDDLQQAVKNFLKMGS